MKLSNIANTVFLVLEKGPRMETRKKGRKAHKPRIDSLGEEMSIMQEGYRNKIAPPSYMPLKREEKPFWNSIISELSKSECSGSRLELAVWLSRTMASLEREQRLLDQEGSVITIKNVAGFETKRIANPRSRLISDYAQRATTLRRGLGLHTRAQDGEARDVAKRRAHAKSIEDILESIDDPEGLIARPGRSYKD